MTTLEQLDQWVIPSDLTVMMDKVEAAMANQPERGMDDIATTLVYLSMASTSNVGPLETAKAMTQHLLAMIKLRRQLRKQSTPTEVSRAE